MNRRTGYSLLEVMAAMSVLTTLLLVTAATLHSLYRGSRLVRERSMRQTALARLSLQLRKDTHSASQARLLRDPPGRPRLQLTWVGAERVEYRLEDAAVTRVVWDGSRLVHRDQFRLDGRTSLAWQMADDDPRWVRLQIRQGSRQGKRPGGSAGPAERESPASAESKEEQAFALMIEAYVGLLPGVRDEGLPAAENGPSEVPNGGEGTR